MMKEVYSKAVSVLIWLGSAQISTANALASIEKIYKQCLEVLGGLEHLIVRRTRPDARTSLWTFSTGVPAAFDCC